MPQTVVPEGGFGHRFVAYLRETGVHAACRNGAISTSQAKTVVNQGDPNNSWRTPIARGEIASSG
jgi:hypothetical protein